MIPLRLLNSGDKFKIIKIEGGRGLLQKTLDLGLVPNNIWIVAQNTGIGPIIVQKDDLKIGIGVGMAKRIFVEIISDGEANEK